MENLVLRLIHNNAIEVTFITRISCTKNLAPRPILIDSNNNNPLYSNKQTVQEIK
ncbi:MAG: hypothetical protein MHPSP_004561, partial [Paramarteilia canceri]